MVIFLLGVSKWFKSGRENKKIGERRCLLSYWKLRLQKHGNGNGKKKEVGRQIERKRHDEVVLRRGTLRIQVLFDSKIIHKRPAPHAKEKDLSDQPADHGVGQNQLDLQLSFETGPECVSTLETFQDINGTYVSL